MKRTKFSVVESDPNVIFASARHLFTTGRHYEGLDLYEQLMDTFPQFSTQVLAEVYDQYMTLPHQDRYTLYQARHFDFNIQPGDKVLDIGSGHKPFPLATHLAEYALSDGSYGRAGHDFKHVEGLPVTECSVEDMPFADKEFDFVYCSHVLEHVQSPENACKELMRVSKRGYIETPTRGKDLWMNSSRVSNHIWSVEWIHNKLIFTQYTEEEIDGLRCDILASMHGAPETDREKAFSALVWLKSDKMNTMVAWDDSFAYEVRRLPAANRQNTDHIGASAPR